MQTLSKNKIKLVRSLQRKKIRDEHNLFLVEGRKSVEEAVSTHPELVEFVCSSTDEEINTEEQYYLPHEELSKISALTSSNGWIAVLRKPELNITDNEFTVVLDGIQDPGNLGTILRTCDWFGIDHVICSTDTVDCFNEKVVQASMGSIFRVKVTYCDLPAFLSEFDKPVYGALMEGENVFSKKNDPVGALILGNEGNGIRPEIVKFITHPIHIPGTGNAESLNVAIAGAILLAEFKGRTL